MKKIKKRGSLLQVIKKGVLGEISWGGCGASCTRSDLHLCFPEVTSPRAGGSFSPLVSSVSAIMSSSGTTYSSWMLTFCD